MIIWKVIIYFYKSGNIMVTEGSYKSKRVKQNTRIIVHYEKPSKMF